MPENITKRIPALYRFYFKWSDPTVLFFSVYMYFVTPDEVINAFIPISMAPRNPHHDFLTQQVGGALLMLAILTSTLLRYTEDVKIWKILEAAILVYDFALLYVSYYALSQQRRLSIGALRVEDWGKCISKKCSSTMTVLMWKFPC